MERVGLYPGTFDPITNGHLDIITRASKIVDRLVIGVAINRDKGPLFDVDERVAMVEAESAAIVGPNVARIEVRRMDGLLVRFAQELDAQVIFRGLRAVSDFEYEFQMAGMNDKLAPDSETVFLMAAAENQAIASKLVKEIARLGGDVSHFVTPTIRDRLLTRFRDGR